MTILSEILMVIGGLFLALGGFGIFRMPDVLNRIQAGTKASTLGAFSMVIGVGIYNTDYLFKAILIVIFIAISNPVGSSVLAKAAYKANKDRVTLVVDAFEKEGESDAD